MGASRRAAGGQEPDWPAEEAFRVISELTTDYAYSMKVTDDGSLTREWVSPGYVEVTGFTPEELDPVEGWRRLIHPDDLPHLIERKAQLQASNDAHIDEFRIVTKSGGIRWLRTYTRSVRDPVSGQVTRMYGAAQDVTDRKQAEEALKESEGRFRQIAENIRQILWLRSPSHDQLLYVSPAYEEIVGRSCESAYQEPTSWIEAVHPDDRKRVMAESTSLEGPPSEHEYRIVRPDGSIRWITGRRFPIRDEAGTVYLIAGISEDVTERRRIEEQLHQAQKLEAVGRLAGGVAHDFNNLLTIVLNAGRFLEEELSPADPRLKDVRDVISAGQRGARLVRQLLAFSQQEIVEPKNLDLNEVVRAVEGLLVRTLGEDIVLTIDLSPSLWSTRGDANQLEHVLINLALNAKDAMPQGGTLRIETTNLAVDDADGDDPAVSPGKYVRLQVSDTGTGIEPAALDRVFEPFFSTKAKAEASGLGLSVVYGIVAQARGRIRVESEIGRGSVFSIFLPAAGELAQASPEEGEQPSRAIGTRGTILVVEDDPSVRRIVARILARGGFKVLQAGGPGEAQSVAETYPESIDLVVADVIMPEGSGPAVFRRLRESRPDLKVLFFSGHGQQKIGRQGILSEDDNYLEKPFSPEALLARVNQLLGR